jgi:DNA-binding CsgD family transcriptional regulator
MNLRSTGIAILDEFLTPLHIDKHAHKLITDLNRDEKQQDGKHSFLLDEIYHRCEALRETAWFRKKPELAQDCFDLDIGSGQTVSVFLRLIDNPNKAPVFLVCIKPGCNATFALPLDDRLSELNLSAREREVAYLVYQGLRNSEISKKLNISRYTVENHLKSIFEKLQVNSRTRLAHQLTKSL